MEWRTIPRADFFRELDHMKAHVATESEPAMKAADPAARFGEPAPVPGLSLSHDHARALIVRQSTGAIAAGKMSYGTGGGLYQAPGIPTILCGPGSVAQAHKPDALVVVEPPCAMPSSVGWRAGC